jgi:hypothetical protein
VPARDGVLIIYLRSGGGKAERFDVMLLSRERSAGK